MQLKIQRTQRMGGVMGNTAVFCLDVQAEYARPEAANIAKYKLGKQVIYNSRASRKHLDRAKAGSAIGGFWGYAGGAVSLALAKMSLNISIDSLGRGQHIECKDMLELLEAEEEVMTACRMLKRFLETAATFNGSIALIDFDDGEKLHTGQGVLEFAGEASAVGAAGAAGGLVEYMPSEDTGRDEYESWVDRLEAFMATPLGKYGTIAAGAVVVLFVLVKWA